MDLIITIILLLTFVGFAVLFGWLGARPRDYSKPRLVNWQLMMLLMAAAVLVMVVHLLNVLGMTTGANR